MSSIDRPILPGKPVLYPLALPFSKLSENDLTSNPDPVMIEGH
jgi:hypothetical protein